MTPMVARRVLVHGVVQGVGFRWNCQHVAQSLGVAGWAANRADGGVEVHAEGPEDAVARLVEWCRRGPRHAVVTRVETMDATPRGLTTFSVH